MNKHAKVGGMMITFMILGILAVSILGYAVFMKPTSAPAPSPGAPTISGCGVEDTTVTLAASNKYTNAAAGGTHKYRVNGAPASSIADAGTFTASPGDKVEVLWGNASLTGNYGVVQTYDIPCVGTKTLTASLVNNGTLTTRVFNEEGNIIDTAGENETITNGDVVNLNWEIQGTYQTDYPHGLVLVIEYNSSSIDDVIPKLGGVALTTTTVPSMYSSTTYGGQSGKKAFIVPPLLSNDKQTGTFTIDADDTFNPGDSANGDIALTYYAKNYFVNEDKQGAFDGPAAEDEDSAGARSGSVAYTLSID